jgi:phosphoadenosine phosphosulfate reductase
MTRLDLHNQYGHLRGVPLIKVMARVLFRNKCAVLSSFGAESALLLAMVAKVDRDLPVFFLNTGKHFTETLSFKEEIIKKLGLKNIIEVRPESGDLNEDLWQERPDLCCDLRKKRPLQKIIQDKGIKAILTGRKRFQTPERQNLLSIEQDDQGLFKINPLAFFTEHEISAQLEKVDLPEHPLVQKGYLSIGCEPCTRPVCKGEDPRKGRWPEKEKTECGIHL